MRRKEAATYAELETFLGRHRRQQPRRNDRGKHHDLVRVLPLAEQVGRQKRADLVAGKNRPGGLRANGHAETISVGIIRKNEIRAGLVCNIADMSANTIEP